MESVFSFVCMFEFDFKSEVKEEKRKVFEEKYLKKNFDIF